MIDRVENISHIMGTVLVLSSKSKLGNDLPSYDPR